MIADIEDRADELDGNLAPRVRWYKGSIINRAGRNASGVRWHAFTPTGQVRADTLAGIKQLISEAAKGGAQ